MVNLTNKLVASVKPSRDKKYIRLWDSNISGFGLRVTDKGAKSFIFEGRQGLSKKTKQVKVGRVGEMSVAEARRWLVCGSQRVLISKIPKRVSRDSGQALATDKFFAFLFYKFRFNLASNSNLLHYSFTCASPFWVGVIF